MEIKVFASEGAHPPKTWARIIVNRLIYTDNDAPADVQQKYLDEKHRLESVVAAFVPKIRGEINGVEEKSVEEWTEEIIQQIIDTAPTAKLKKLYRGVREQYATYISTHVQTMTEEVV